MTTRDTVLVRRAARRLGLQAAGAAAGVIALLVAITVVVLVREQSTTEAARLTATISQADDVTDPPAGMWLTIRAGGHTESTSGLPAGLPLVDALDQVAAGGSAELTAVTLNGHDYLVGTAARTTRGGPPRQVQAVLDRGPDEAQLASLVRALLIGGGGALPLTVAVGTWLGRRAVRPLQSALAMQRRFVADASHELRTPLTLLSTRAQMLRRRVRRTGEAVDWQDDVDGLVGDADQLRTILEDLLLAADPRTVAWEDVDVVVVAAEVAVAAGSAAADAHVTIRTAGEASAVVAGSAVALRRALLATVDNAIRYAVSTVEVAVRHEGRRVVVRVSDDGPGIDAAMLPHLFQRFATTGDNGLGPRRYGLGLALVSEVAERHGGAVSAENAPGGGAVVRIELPGR